MLFNTNFSQNPQTKKSLFLTSSNPKMPSIPLSPSYYSVKKSENINVALEEDTQYVPKISIRDLNGRDMLHKEINTNIFNKNMFFNLQKKECFSCNYH